MESAAKELDESSDDGASKDSSHCLAISLILRKVLKLTSNTDLLTLSLVNKQWNYEARCVMRDRGSTIASLKAGSARELLDLMLDVRRMLVVPFSGMKIVLHARRLPADPLELTPQEMTFIYTVIFNRPTLLKHFHIVDQVGFGGFDKNNPRFIFVRKVLQDYCGVPEEIEITLGPRNGSCLQEFFKRCSFPNLKKFSFNGDYDDALCNTDLVNAVVSNAANLQELHVGWWYVISEENVLDRSSAMLVPRDFDFVRDWLSESIASRMKLESLYVSSIGHYRAQEFSRIIHLMLQGSRTSLKPLKIASVLAVPIMCHDICLENVSELTMYMDCRALGTPESAVSTSLQGFDFARIFPNLHEVSIESRSSNIRSDDLREFVRQSQAVLKKPSTDRAANIKYLSFSDGLYRSSTAKFFAEMFPDIERLSIVIEDDRENPFRLIWEHWLELKEIKIQINEWIRGVPWIANLDSIFCGIFPEEVDELRGKDDEYLRCVNIVPVMPSITCLKNLRKITVAFQWFILCKPNKDLVSAFLRSGNPFSKVTSLTAFAKCPDLCVTLESNWPPMEKALTHMKPYASVVLTP